MSVRLPVQIDRASPIPLYHQLAEQLSALIEGGTLKPGDLLGQAKPVEHWEELVNRYVDIPLEKSEYKDAMAATLSEIAQQRHMPLVRQLLVDTSLGVSRIHFYRTLTRTRAADRWALIEAGLDDPDLEKEAAHLLHQRQLRASRRRR